MLQRKCKEYMTLYYYARCYSDLIRNNWIKQQNGITLPKYVTFIIASNTC